MPHRIPLHIGNSATLRHGKCAPCLIVWAWPKDGPRVRSALCPQCFKPLLRTVEATLGIAFERIHRVPLTKGLQ